MLLKQLRMDVRGYLEFSVLSVAFAVVLVLDITVLVRWREKPPVSDGIKNINNKKFYVSDDGMSITDIAACLGRWRGFYRDIRDNYYAMLRFVLF